MRDTSKRESEMSSRTRELVVVVAVMSLFFGGLRAQNPAAVLDP